VSLVVVFINLLHNLLQPKQALTRFSLFPDDSSDDDDDDDDVTLGEDTEESDEVAIVPNPKVAVRGIKRVKVNPTSLAGLELVRSEEEAWLPLFILGAWLSVNMVMHVVLAIIGPSGVGFLTSKDIKLHLEKGNTELVIIVTWPLWVLNLTFLELLSALERGTEDFVLMKQALAQRLAEMRPTQSSPLKSVARIPLPFEVRAGVGDDDWWFLGEATSGTRVILVDLKEPSSGEYEEKKAKSCTMA
jgi:hypothetical protein